MRRTSGLGQLSNPKSIMGSTLPASIGGGVAAATTVGIRYLMEPTSEAQMKAMEMAPLIGWGAGLLTAAALGFTSGKHVGWATAAGATGVWGALVVSEMSAREKLKKLASPETLTAMKPYGLGGHNTRAIVPEYSNTRGLGAVAMEPHASRGYGAGPLGSRKLGAYGDTVNLGQVSASAFGTQGFTVAGAR